MASSSQTVLIIDDEKSIQKLLRVCLEAEGYKVVSALTGQEGLVAAANVKPDVIILDILLPDQNGLAVLKSMREWASIPILILSVRGQEFEKITFLDAGADDFITKPFSTGELLARIRVALRHNQPNSESVFKSGALEIDFGKRLVYVAGNPIKLTRKEYKVLSLLATNAGKVVTQTQIMREVWKPGLESETNRLRVYIANLRKKIEDQPDKPTLIVTEPAVGYRLQVL